MVTHKNKETILVVAAHQDDEVLGCGGTIAKHADQGDDVYVLILADGVTSRGKGQKDVDLRNQVSADAAAILGAHAPILLNLPDNRMDSLSLLEVVQLIEPFIEKINPDIIYTHHGYDLNIDHQITHRAVLTACRPSPSSKITAIFSFEVLSSTELSLSGQTGTFSPVHSVDITNTYHRKLEALHCYDSEMKAFPHSRSYKAIESQAILRGAHAGFSVAEAFGVLRQVWR